MRSPCIALGLTDIRLARPMHSLSNEKTLGLDERVKAREETVEGMKRERRRAFGTSDCMRLFALATIALMLANPIEAAQHARTRPAGEAALTNADVLALVKASMPESDRSDEDQDCGR